MNCKGFHEVFQVFLTDRFRDIAQSIFWEIKYLSRNLLRHRTQKLRVIRKEVFRGKK